MWGDLCCPRVSLTGGVGCYDSLDVLGQVTALAQVEGVDALVLVDVEGSNAGPFEGRLGPLAGGARRSAVAGSHVAFRFWNVPS